MYYRDVMLIVKIIPLSGHEYLTASACNQGFPELVLEWDECRAELHTDRKKYNWLYWNIESHIMCRVERDFSNLPVFVFLLLLVCLCHTSNQTENYREPEIWYKHSS